MENEKFKLQFLAAHMPLLTIAQAAKILGIGRALAYKLIAAGQWPTPIVQLAPGGVLRIRTVDLAEYLFPFSSSSSTPCAAAPRRGRGRPTKAEQLARARAAGSPQG